MQNEQCYPFHWLSQQGRRPSNQDYGAIVHNGATNFAVITDGISWHKESGDLARELCHFLAGRAEKYPLKDTVFPDRMIREWLSLARREVGAKFPYSATAYAIAWQSGSTLYTWHEGDCRVGTLSENGTLTWATSDHSIAMWQKVDGHDELIKDPMRHRLYKCFKSTRGIDPDMTVTNISQRDVIVLATDGFWAGVPEDLHARAAEVESLPDDISASLADNTSRLTICPSPSRYPRSTATNFRVTEI